MNLVNNVPSIGTLVTRLIAMAPLPLANIHAGILLRWWKVILRVVNMSGTAPLWTGNIIWNSDYVN